MAINILQELNLGSAKPSFSRDEVASLDAIKNLQENKYPDNYEIFCKEDGCKYRLNKTAHSTMQGFLSHPTGKWRRSDSVISSSMPRPITINDVILYLGPTTYSQQYSDKILFQTGKYYRTEYGVTNKQMYAYVQNIESGVPDENEPPAVIWYSDSETLSVNSILYKPVNGSIKNNMEHPIIITAEPASQTEISGEEYIYGDGSEETKPGLVRNSKYDSTFDSYPVLEWKLFDTEAELENFKENVIPETVKDEVATALEDVNIEELAGLGDKVSSLSDSIDSLTESIPEDGMTYLNSTLYSGKQWSYLNQPTSYNYNWTSYNKLLKVNNDLYDHTDNNRNISPLFKNYFDSASSESYVTPKNVITYDSDSPTWSSKSYVGAMVCIDSTNVPVSSILTRISGYIVERKTSKKFYLEINKYRGIELELCDIYIGWSTTLAANNITSDRYVWERVDATKPANVANILSNLTPKQAYYNYPVIFMVFRAISYDSNHDTNPLFESDVLTIPTEDVINHYLTISYRKLEDKIEGIANSVDKLEEDLESLDPESISEAAEKVARLDPLTDEMISEITTNVETAIITGGNSIDWEHVFSAGDISYLMQNVKSLTVEAQIEANETGLFIIDLDDFTEDDRLLEDNSSTHVGFFMGPAHYVLTYSAEFMDLYFKDKEYYHDGIIDATVEGYEEEALTNITAMFRETSLGTHCMYINSALILPGNLRCVTANYTEELLRYTLTGVLDTYTAGTIEFDVDELWIGVSCAINGDKVIEYMPSEEEYYEMFQLMYTFNEQHATFIRLAVRDSQDASNNSFTGRLSDIHGLKEILQDKIDNILEEIKSGISGITDEEANEFVIVRLSLLTPISIHGLTDETRTFDVQAFIDAHITNTLTEHFSLVKDEGTFMDYTNRKISNLVAKDKEIDRTFDELEPKLAGLTGPVSYETIVSPGTDNGAPSIDNLDLCIANNLSTRTFDGFRVIQSADTPLRAPFEGDITSAQTNYLSDNNCLCFIGQLTTGNGENATYALSENLRMLDAEMTVDASKMPEGMVLEQVVLGLIPCMTLDCASSMVAVNEPARDFSNGPVTIKLNVVSSFTPFVKSLIEDDMDLSAYAISIMIAVNVGTQAEDASFLNDLDLSIFNNVITFKVPGENLLDNLPELQAEKERTSQVSDKALKLLNIMGDSLNISDVSKTLKYSMNIPSLIKHTSVYPVTSHYMNTDSGSSAFLTNGFNGLIYLGENFVQGDKTLKPELKNYILSDQASYVSLDDMMLPSPAGDFEKLIGLFAISDVVLDDSNSSSSSRPARSLAELKSTVKEHDLCIEHSSYEMPYNVSIAEVTSNVVFCPSDATSISGITSFSKVYDIYVAVVNSTSSDDFNIYNNTNTFRDLTKFKWTLWDTPTKSLYETIKDLTDADFADSGDYYFVGIIAVLGFQGTGNSAVDDYKELDFTDQISKVCYTGYNKIAEIEKIYDNSESAKQTIGLMSYQNFNATPIAFAAQSVDSESGSDPVNYDAIIYPRLVLPPELDSSTNTYTVRFHGTTEEENNLTVNDLVTNGDVFMFFSFFGDNLLHVNFGGDYSHGDTKLSELDKLNRTGGIVWYNTRYMKDSSIDFSQHGDYDASELFVNIDSSLIRELYATVIPNDSPSNSIQQYFTSKYNSSTGKLLETMSDIPGFVKVPLGYHEEDLTGTKRTVSLETIIDLCGRPAYSGSINPKGGYILFVAKLNETKAGVTKYLNDYTYYHYPISSFHPFNNYQDNFGYYSAYDFGWYDIFPNSQNVMDNPPCYITRSLADSIKQAKNVALKAAQEAAADKTKVPTFYTSYSNLKNDIQNGGMGYLVKVDPNNSDKYVADVYIKTLDGTIIKMSENVECEPSQSIINALNG